MVGVGEEVLLQANATAPVVVDFLIHLRQDEGLSVSAVKGYNSALNSVIALWVWDLSDSLELRCFVVFARSVDLVKIRSPLWDVSLILQGLTRLLGSLCGHVGGIFWLRRFSSSWPLLL